MLQNEFLFYNVVLDNDLNIIFNGKKYQIKTFVDYIDSQVQDLAERMRFLSREMVDTMMSPYEKCITFDRTFMSVYVKSVRSLMKFLHKFDPLDETEVKKCFMKIASLDPYRFSKTQVSYFIDCKILFDISWLLIQKYLYLDKLSKVAGKGKSFINSTFIAKTSDSRGLGGPFGNVDLPIQERVFTWDQIDEEMRGMSRDVRSHPKFRMALENNKDSIPSEGFVWKERNSEPFSWYDRETEDPYYKKFYSGDPI